MDIRIRESRETDRAILDELFADEEVSRRLAPASNDDSRIPESRKSLEEAYRFTVLSDGQIAGMVALEYPSGSRNAYQVNFAVGREFWDQGVGTEALKQAVRFGFDDLKIDLIFGDIDSDDPASERAFREAGFRKAAVWKEHVYKDGRYVDTVLWSLTRSDRTGGPGGGAPREVRIRAMRERDAVTSDRLYADEDVARQIYLPSQEDLVPGCPSSGSRGYNRSFRNERWIPDFRRSLKDGYGFTIVADEEIAGEIVLEHPSVCRSTYRVGYAVGRRFWNQGICTEAVRQVVRFAFDELKIHKLACDTDSDNPASLRVLEKAGFRRVGAHLGVQEEPGLQGDGSAYAVEWDLINPASEDQNPQMHKRR